VPPAGGRAPPAARPRPRRSSSTTFAGHRRPEAVGRGGGGEPGGPGGDPGRGRGQAAAGEQGEPVAVGGEPDWGVEAGEHPTVMGMATPAGFDLPGGRSLPCPSGKSEGARRSVDEQGGRAGHASPSQDLDVAAGDVGGSSAGRGRVDGDVHGDAPGAGWRGCVDRIGGGGDGQPHAAGVQPDQRPLGRPTNEALIDWRLAWASKLATARSVSVRLLVLAVTRMLVLTGTLTRWSTVQRAVPRLPGRAACLP
jgi:hypothetical protein